MSEILTAIYQDGAFVPEQATSILAGVRVRLVVEPIQAAAGDLALKEFDDLCDEIGVDSGAKRMTRDELHERR